MDRALSFSLYAKNFFLLTQSLIFSIQTDSVSLNTESVDIRLQLRLRQTNLHKRLTNYIPPPPLARTGTT
jgi:hypothetical protein